MSIYVGDKKAVLYRGDYHPAQFYKGDVKIAGYNVAEKQGTEVEFEDTYNDNLDFKIYGKSEQNGIPSPDYPSPIRSSENFDVVSCGRNLFDPVRFVSEINATIPSAAKVQDWQGVPCVSYPCSVSILRFMHHQFKANTQYTISGEVGFDRSQEAQIEFMALTYTDGTQRAIYVTNVVTGVFSTFRFTTIANKTVDYIVVNSYSPSLLANIKIASLQLEEGATANPYQPYHATTAHITDPLRSVGDVADTIEVAGGKVDVVRRVVRFALVTTTPAFEHSYIDHNSYTHFRVPAQLGNLQDECLCNLLPYVWKSWSVPIECVSCRLSDIYPTFSNVVLGISNTDTADQRVSKLKSWLTSNEMYVNVLPATPTRTDITATPLGQSLLSMRTIPHYTRIYTNADIKPHLLTNVKTIDRS